jgi:uncharacterized membrane protein YcaP (DUF421 family)
MPVGFSRRPKAVSPVLPSEFVKASGEREGSHHVHSVNQHRRVVYAFILFLLRIIGKKHIGEMAPFDLVVLLILSESVQNALVADDKSLIGGLVVAATLFATNQLLGYATWRSKTLARLFEGTPCILVRNGRVCSDVLASEQVTHSELLEALRKEGCTSLVNVRYAVLENDGSITIGLRARAR